jgi:hypothetical protein
MRTLAPAAGRRGGQLTAIALLLGLGAAMVVPQDVVWCRGSDGHNALEPVWAGCCVPADGGSSCSTGTAPLEPATDLTLPALSTAAHCEDLWLGSPVSLSPLPPAPPLGLYAMATPAGVPRPPGSDVRPSGARSSTLHLRHVRELISTTVLTI